VRTITDLSGASWRKASLSAHNGGCVEVAVNLPGVTAIRDSKRPDGGALVVDRAAFAAFLADVRSGRYDVWSRPGTPGWAGSRDSKHTPQKHQA